MEMETGPGRQSGQTSSNWPLRCSTSRRGEGRPEKQEGQRRERGWEAREEAPHKRRREFHGNRPQGSGVGFVRLMQSHSARENISQGRRRERPPRSNVLG